MSAPDTNIEKQKHRHRTMGWGLWIGAALAVLVGLVFVVAFGVFDVAPDAFIPATGGAG